MHACAFSCACGRVHLAIHTCIKRTYFRLACMHACNMHLCACTNPCTVMTCKRGKSQDLANEIRTQEYQRIRGDQPSHTPRQTFPVAFAPASSRQSPPHPATAQHREHHCSLHPRRRQRRWHSAQGRPANTRRWPPTRSTATPMRSAAPLQPRTA